MWQENSIPCEKKQERPIKFFLTKTCSFSVFQQQIPLLFNIFLAVSFSQPNLMSNSGNFLVSSTDISFFVAFQKILVKFADFSTFHKKTSSHTFISGQYSTKHTFQQQFSLSQESSNLICHFCFLFVFSTLHFCLLQLLNFLCSFLEQCINGIIQLVLFFFLFHFLFSYGAVCLRNRLLPKLIPSVGMEVLAPIERITALHDLDENTTLRVVCCSGKQHNEQKEAAGSCSPHFLSIESFWKDIPYLNILGGIEESSIYAMKLRSKTYQNSSPSSGRSL